MRTEETLLAALAEREQLAPDPEPVLAGARRLAARHRRRRAVGTAVTGALVLVTVSSLPVLVDRATGGPGPGAGHPASPLATAPSVPAAAAGEVVVERPPFSFTVAAGTVDAVDIQPFAVTPDYQVFRVRTLHPRQLAAQLVVYQPGVDVIVGGEEAGWDVTDSPVPTEVGGAAAWFSINAHRSALRWEYSEDAWAVLGGAAPLPESDLRRLAEAVRFTQPYPAKVPYRLGYLPPDLRTIAVTQYLSGPGDRVSSWQFESVEQRRAVDITTAGNAPMGSDWDWRATTIAGYPARYADLIDGRRCEVDLGGLTVSIGCGGLTPEELDRLVAGIELASWDDPTTWYDVDAALPDR